MRYKFSFMHLMLCVAACVFWMLSKVFGERRVIDYLWGDEPKNDNEYPDFI